MTEKNKELLYLMGLQIDNIYDEMKFLIDSTEDLKERMYLVRDILSNIKKNEGIIE